MADKILMQKGLKANLPANAQDNVMLFTVDTHEFYRGQGLASSLAKVGDVYSFATAAAFPVTGMIDKLYLDKSSRSVYVWTGTAYATATDAHTHSNKATLDLVATATAETKTHLTYNGDAVAFLTETNSKLALKADLVNGRVPLSQLPEGVKETLVVADITARNALANKYSGLLAWVIDASGDATVGSGAALYICNGSAWAKLTEAESLDLDLSPYMLIASYDSNADGRVDAADTAAKVDGVDASASTTYYGKDQSGTVGFHDISMTLWGSF
jgi:hypothetical protein